MFIPQSKIVLPDMRPALLLQHHPTVKDLPLSVPYLTIGPVQHGSVDPHSLRGKGHK